VSDGGWRAQLGLEWATVSNGRVIVGTWGRVLCDGVPHWVGWLVGRVGTAEPHVLIRQGCLYGVVWHWCCQPSSLVEWRIVVRSCELLLKHPGNS